MSRVTSELAVASTIAIRRKDMGVSIRLWLVQFLSALQAHTVGICVLSALYVDSDVAASFSLSTLQGLES